jgi:hypothetical protein
VADGGSTPEMKHPRLRNEKDLESRVAELAAEVHVLEV